MITQSLKAIGISCLAALLLTACGGGNDDNMCCDIIPNSSSSSSVASSVASSAASSVASSASSTASSVSSSAASSSASSVDPADMSFGFSSGIEGWYINGQAAGTIVTTNLSLEHDAINSALKISPLDWTENAASNWKYQARMEFDAVTDLSNSRIEYTVSIPQSYITDGTAEFQFIINAVDSINTSYGGTAKVSELPAPNDDGDYVIGRDINLATAAGIGFQLAKAPTDTAIKDAILIKNVFIDRPSAGASSSSSEASSAASSEASSSSSAAASNLLKSFETDAVDTIYGATAWNTTTDITTSVVTIASVTAGSGLPANASSVNVLKVMPKNYDAIPLFSFTLPAGKTLADYTVQAEIYFPRSTLGLTEDGDNYYKPLLLLAGTTVTSGANDTNPAYQSTYSTIYSDVDVWGTFSLTPDATKAALLTGAIQVAFGLSRPGDTVNDDSYYIDNVQLVPIP